MLNSWKKNLRAKLHSFFSWCWLSYDGQLGYKLFAANHRQTQLLAEWFFSLGIFMFFFGIFSYKKRTLGSYLLVQWQLSFFHNFFYIKIQKILRHWAGKVLSWAHCDSFLYGNHELYIVGLSSLILNNFYHFGLNIRIDVERRISASQMYLATWFRFNSKIWFICVCKITRITFVEMGIEVLTFSRSFFSFILVNLSCAYAECMIAHGSWALTKNCLLIK